MCNALETYLTKQDLSYTAFADLIGCRPQTVGRYVSGNRIPTKSHMKNIYVVTHGKVSPNDFYDLPSFGGDDRDAGLSVNAPAHTLRESICSGSVKFMTKDSRDFLPGQVDMFGQKASEACAS